MNTGVHTLCSYTFSFSSSVTISCLKPINPYYAFPFTLCLSFITHQSCNQWVSPCFSNSFSQGDVIGHLMMPWCHPYLSSFHCDIWCSRFHTMVIWWCHDLTLYLLSFIHLSSLFILIRWLHWHVATDTPMSQCIHSFYMDSDKPLYSAPQSLLCPKSL